MINKPIMNQLLDGFGGNLIKPKLSITKATRLIRTRFKGNCSVLWCGVKKSLNFFVIHRQIFKPEGV